MTGGQGSDLSEFEVGYVDPDEGQVRRLLVDATVAVAVVAAIDRDFAITTPLDPSSAGGAPGHAGTF